MAIKMKKIKVSEIFYSIQGEGMYTGVPSIFLRTFGCNLTCEGFGMPPGEKSRQRFDMRIEDILEAGTAKSIHDLPLVSTGCDSYASWDVRFKHLSPAETTEAIAKELQLKLPVPGALLANWVMQDWGGVHLVITGGEPLLGWQRAYVELFEHPYLNSLTNITFETNGTQKLHKDLSEYLLKHKTARGLNHFLTADRRTLNFNFSVSPKLSASGEDPAVAIQPDIVASYGQHGDVNLKFVCNTEEHILEALDVVSQYKAAGLGEHNVWIMPEGGMSTNYNANARPMAELCMKYKLNYSPRLHVDLFGNAWAT
jgi:organic radical activating enzyme